MRQFYQKIREVEASITDPFVLIVSLDTEDGGIAGALTEVARKHAARLIVEQRARLASADEEEAHREEMKRLRIEAERAAEAAAARFTLLTDAEIRMLRGSKKG